MQKAAILRLLTAAPVVTATVLAATTASYAATTGTVQGTIKSAEGLPLSGVNVFLEGTDRTTKTDKNGYYVFTGVQPGSYEVRVELVTFQTVSEPVAVLQDQTITTDFALEKETIQTGTATIIGAPIRRLETTTQHSITARTEQLTKARPTELYQFPGLVFGQPGIVTNLQGNVHIRGADVNQTGYQVDGVTITEPITNSFGTTLVTVGLKNANLYTGGMDASYGGYLGGFINQVTQNGRDLRGSILEYTGGPGSGHAYSGTNLQYGDLFGKTDVFGAFIGFRNRFPGDTMTSFRDNADGLLKVNYYADPNNTVTAFHSQGFQKTDFLVPRDRPQYRKYEGSANTAVVGTEFQQDRILQGNALSYLTYKHNFNPQSFATYRLYRLYTFGTFHVENIGGQFQHRDATQIGNQFDYTNQITPQYRIQTGLHRINMDTNREVIQGIGFDQTSAAAPASGYIHRITQVKPVQTVVYLNNQLKPMGDRLTLDLGLRYSQMRYNLKKFESFTNHATDPRVGITYSPARDLAFRSSYSFVSQFPDVQLIEILFPQDLGFATAKNPAAQQANMQRFFVQRNRLRTQHAQNWDLGVEKGFQFRGGSYNATLTGFRRHMYDLAQVDRPSYAPPSPLTGYDNAGTAHSSGIEFKLDKRRRNESDLNGFLSYTNQVARATSSLNDTFYNPYFFRFVSDPRLTDAQIREMNRQEFPTMYDQKHTIALVANKRVSKSFETTLIVDAGSGFPFSGGAASDGRFGGADPQHGEKLFGGANFSEVPVVLMDRQTIQPFNPVVGRSGWHSRISLNSNFYVNPNTWFFLNADNIFNQKTVLRYATRNAARGINYDEPTAEYPQGRIYYGPETQIRPLFLSFGIRTRF